MIRKAITENFSCTVNRKVIGKNMVYRRGTKVLDSCRFRNKL